MEEAKNDADKRKRGGVPFRLIAVFIAALVVGFALANPGFGLLGSPAPAGCSGSTAYAANTNNNTNSQYYAVSANISGATTPANSSGTAQPGEVQEIRMTVDSKGWSPTSFVLKKGVKVRWVIDAKILYSCTNEVISEEYGIDAKLKVGENVVEFTPDKVGTFGFHCGMNMIRGTFVVVNDPTNQTEVSNVSASAPTQTRNGGCGCGMMAGGTCGR